MIDEEVFVHKFACIQQGLNELQDTFAQVNPDVVVMFGDDQDELFFEDNYPMISVYWGDILTHYPRTLTRPGMSEAIRHLGVGLRHRGDRLSRSRRSSGCTSCRSSPSATSTSPTPAI